MIHTDDATPTWKVDCKRHQWKSSHGECPLCEHEQKWGVKIGFVQTDRITELEVQVKRGDALAVYTKHKDSCLKDDGFGALDVCSCGLDKTLAAYKESK
jgi:hypothetical protein